MSTTQPTLVTAVFDLGRDTLTPPYWRDKDHYRRHLPVLLAIDCPMVVYADAAHIDLVRELRKDLPTVIVEMDPVALAAHEAYAPVHAIRTDPDWLAQAYWLPASPQAALPGYNPVVMSKLLWLDDQRIANPFGSDRFYWIDSGIHHTVSEQYLNGAAFRALTGLHDRFLLLAFPQLPDNFGHGFDAQALARLAGVDRARWIARGTFFGGPAHLVEAAASRYDDLMHQTLADGLMGTEESLLTIMSYADADLFDLQFVYPNGLVFPFFEQLHRGWLGDPVYAGPLLETLCETWFQSHNTPLQFERLLQSIEAAAPALLRTARRVLINNSTDRSTFEDYDAICARYGVEQLREGNRGVDGGRLHAARLFHRGGRHAMFWFEDDMLLKPETGRGEACANGLPRYVPDLGYAAFGVLQREFADYVALSYTEDDGAHAAQTAWSAMAPEVREQYFPGEVIAPRTAFRAIGAFGPASYAVGDAALSHWPHLIDRRAAARVFLASPDFGHAAYWTARSYELLTSRELKAAVLLASPVTHDRTQHYPIGGRIIFSALEGAAALDASPAPTAAPAPPGRPDYPPQPGTIFVSVANYRDSETPHTVASLFANAVRPERIHVGVLSQVVPGDDDDCLPGAPAVGQLREVRVHASESRGACWARSRIQQELMQGEEYFLQIDSHSRFEPGWDETLIDMLGRCSSSRAVITTYPPAYTPPHKLDKPMVTLLVGYAYNEFGILLFKTRCLDSSEPVASPLPSAFLSGNCLFGPAAAFREVPYDPKLYFHGEEISLAVRLWTHGWDLYAPDRAFMYHDYSADRGRPRNWDDHVDWHVLNQRSFNRLRHLFGMESKPDPAVQADLSPYGLGSVRTLAEYEEFADVTFAEGRLGPRAADGRFPHPTGQDSLERGRVERARFRDADAGAVLQTPPLETRSGQASTMAATKELRPALGQWLTDQGVKRLVDAGCGDFNWMRAVDLAALELYAGYDLVPQIVADNQRLYGGARGVLFSTGDILTQPLPTCDAILCRHVLDRMAEADIGQALENFRQTGARWLLATGELGLGEPEATLPGGTSGLKVWRLRS